MKLKTLALPFAAALAVTLSATGGEERKGKVFELNELPAPVKETLQTEAAGGKIDSIVRLGTYYVVQLNLNEEAWAFTVNESATATEGPGRLGREKVEGIPVAWSDLPAAVQGVLSRRFEGVKFLEIRRGLYVFAATVQKNGERVPVRVNELGKVLRSRELDVRAEQEREHEFRIKSERDSRGGGGAPGGGLGTPHREQLKTEIPHPKPTEEIRK